MSRLTLAKPDGRKNNRPPKRPAAIDAATVAVIDQIVAKGVKQTWIAKQLGVHGRTVMAVVNRTGAYKGYQNDIATTEGETSLTS